MEWCTNSKFSFSFIEKTDILKEIKNLPVNKASQYSDILTKLNKNNSNLLVDFIFTNLSNSITESTFPSLLKLANITPVHKKDNKTSKNCYRPVNILSNISKTYGRFIFKQMSKYFEPFLSKF